MRYLEKLNDRNVTNIVSIGPAKFHPIRLINKFFTPSEPTRNPLPRRSFSLVYCSFAFGYWHACKCNVNAVVVPGPIVFLLTLTVTAVLVVLLPVVDDMKRTGYNRGRFDIAEWAR